MTGQQSPWAQGGPPRPPASGSDHLDRVNARVLAAYPGGMSAEQVQDTLDNPEYYPHIWLDEWESMSEQERADYWEWVDGP